MKNALYRMQSRASFSVVLFSLLLSGCVSFVQRETPGARLSNDKSYVYAQLYLESDKEFLHMNMGLIVENLKTKKRVNIPFSTEKKPIMVSLEPGQYKLRGLVYASATNNILGENVFTPSRLTKTFHLQPGMAFYLVDMHAKSWTATDFGSASQNWTMESIRDNFTETTAIIQENFQGVKSLTYVQAL